MNPQSDSFRDLVVGQLKPLPDFRCRRMFGGSDLYSRGQFFGLICERRLYFRTGNDTRAEYIAAGASFFRPTQINH